MNSISAHSSLRSSNIRIQFILIDELLIFTMDELFIKLYMRREALILVTDSALFAPVDIFSEYFLSNLPTPKS